MNGQLTAGNASLADLDAAAELATNENGRLGLVRARAEKWVAALTALTGLLASVLVVKGPDTVTDLTTGTKLTVGILFAVAFVLLAYATYQGYAAAYGKPGMLDELSPNPIEGLAARLRQARRITAANAQGAVRNAVIATFAAIGLIAAAVAVTWFPPSAPKTAHVCVNVNSTVVAEVAANHLDVTRTGPGTTIGTCP